MSSATLLVRFPDGTIRVGIYYGTSSMALPCLHDTVDEAWNNKDANDFGDLSLPDSPARGTGEPVEVWSGYGAGFWWRATATRERLTSCFSRESEDFEDSPDE